MLSSWHWRSVAHRSVRLRSAPTPWLQPLLDQHIDRLADDARSIKTLDTYRYDAKKLAKFIGGVRVGEATPARLDGALRSTRSTHGTTMARRGRTLPRGALQLRY